MMRLILTAAVMLGGTAATPAQVYVRMTGQTVQSNNAPTG